MPANTPLPIQELFEDNQASLRLAWLAGKSGNERVIHGDAASAADQVGHLNLIHPGRIQVFGHQEDDYLRSLRRHSSLTPTS